MKSLRIINQAYRWPKSTLPILLLAVLMSGAGFQKVQAQDNPFIRLKRVADSQVELKSQSPAVTITKSNQVWKANVRPPIPFKPLEMKDATGRVIPPNEIMTLKNGQKMTAREYYIKLNDLEKNLNQQGYSLRDQQRFTVSKTVTPAQDLDGKRNSAPKSIGQLREGENLRKFMDPTQQAGDAVLKPYARYTTDEKKNLNSIRIEDVNGKIAARKIPTAISPILAVPVSTGALKTINETTTKDWNFGNASTFKAGIRGDLTRYAKIYQFNPQNPEKSKSEFRVTAKGKVYGSLFNHSFDFITASAEYYSPVDADKNMTIKVVVSVVGINVLNLNRNYPQVKTISDRIAKNFDKSFPIRFPIIGPIEFSGKVGVKGMVGLEYEGNLYRTFVSLNAKPLAEISGYAEAGVSIGGFASVGVGGNLTFVKGELDLQGFAGIIFQNPQQIVAAVSYYFGYDLEFLKGNLYVYAEVCHLWCSDWDHSIFSWNGYKSSGTIAEGSKTYVIANTSSTASISSTQLGTQ